MKKSELDALDAEARALLADPRWRQLSEHVNASDDRAELDGPPRMAAEKEWWRRLRDWFLKPSHSVGVGTLALASVVIAVFWNGRGPRESALLGGERGLDRNGPAPVATMRLMCGESELREPYRCRVNDELSVSTMDTAGGHDRAVLTLTPGPSGAAVDTVQLVVRGKEADVEEPIPLNRPGKLRLLVTWTTAAAGGVEARAEREVEVTP